MAQNDVQAAIRAWCVKLRCYSWDDAIPHLERLARRLYERGALDQAAKHLDAQRGILQALKDEWNDVASD